MDHNKGQISSAQLRSGRSSSLQVGLLERPLEEGESCDEESPESESYREEGESYDEESPESESYREEGEIISGQTRSGRKFRPLQVGLLERPLEDGESFDEESPGSESSSEEGERNKKPYCFPRNISDILYCWNLAKVLIRRRAQQIGVNKNVWKAAGLFLLVSIGIGIFNLIASFFDQPSLLKILQDFWISRRNFWFSMDSPIEQFLLIPTSIIILLIVSPTPTCPSDHLHSFIISTIFAMVYFYCTNKGGGTWSIPRRSIPWYYIMLLGFCFFSLKVLISVEPDEPYYYALSRIFVILLVMFLEGYVYFLYICAFLGTVSESWWFTIAMKLNLMNVFRFRDSNRGSQN